MAVGFSSLNQHQQLSSVLLYDGAYFLQILEGPDSAITGLIPVIKADPRHHKIVSLINEPIAKARFAPYGMRWLDLRNSEQLIEVVLGSLNRAADKRVNMILKAFINGQWQDQPGVSLSNTVPQIVSGHAATGGPLVLEPTANKALRDEEAGDLAQQKARFAFQPIVNLDNLSVASYEALIRGQNGQTPAELLGGMQGDELHQFDLQSKEWALAAAAKLGVKCTLALNLLPQSLAVSPDAVDRLVGLIDFYGFKLSQIVVEITEEELIADTAVFMRAVKQLRSAGVRVAIDDFGAGYAGLSLLADFQPDKLKIDRRIVTGIDGDGPRQAIVWAVVEFCNRLGITVVAEGVETLDELRWLHAAGIRHVQGFLLARPATWELPRVEWTSSLLHDWAAKSVAKLSV